MKRTQQFSLNTVSGAPWAFIAVMGVTGAGKSTFIQWASGSKDIEIGHDLESCTSSITAYSFFFKGFNVSLVDTPGFNDTHKSETEVLKDIASWLKTTYEGSTLLTGIIYLHSLANVRMEGSALRNLKMFRQLCGQEPLKNVVLATTFWSKVSEDEAIRREDQLRSTPEFWKEMLDRGSTLQRLDNKESALDIVALLLGKPNVTLQIQQELVENNMSLVDTAAGQAVNEELMRLQRKHQEELKRVQEELHEALVERDYEMQEILENQQRKLDKELEGLRRQQDQLRYDRRAERRKIENKYEARLFELQTELKKKEEKERLQMQDLTFEEAVAIVRANEAKIPPHERDMLGSRIAQLEAKLAEVSGASSKLSAPEKPVKKKKGSSRFLFKALQLALPVTSMALLGAPIPSPFGDGESLRGLFDKIFGDNSAESGI